MESKYLLTDAVLGMNVWVRVPGAPAWWSIALESRDRETRAQGP